MWSVTPLSFADYEQDAEKVRQLRSRLAQKLDVRHKVRLASSLAAALLGGLFEHPAGYSSVVHDLWAIGFPACRK